MEKERKEENPLNTPSFDGGMTAILRTVGCIGDSLSSGEHEHFDENGTVHYDDIYDLSWGQFLARKCGLTVYNFSVGGMTAIRFREFAAYTKVFKPEKACKAYIIALGVNDMGRMTEFYGDYGFGSMDDVDLSDYQKNKPSFVGCYVEIIQRLNELQKGAKIFVMTMPRTGEEKEGNLYDKHAEFLRSLPNYFPNVYVLDFRKYAPLYTQEFKKRYYLNGHMNAMGYKLTADMVATYIDYIINTNYEDFIQIGLVGTGGFDVNVKY